MRIGIIGKTTKLVEAIQAGVEKVMPIHSGEDADFLFIEANEVHNYAKKKLAIFGHYTITNNWDKVIENTRKENNVVDVLILKKKLFSDFTETDLVRAEAFGERIARQLVGLKPEKGREKSSKIRGYIKD